MGSISLGAQQNKSTCSCELLENNETNDKLVIELANSIENSFAASSIDAFNQNFDTEAFLDLIFKDLDVELEDAYISGVKAGIRDASSSLAEKILAEIDNGAYYNFINFHYNIIEKAYYFRFRIYSDETGVNYHDYKVCTDGEKVKINDVYVFLSGEHMSETLHRLLKVSVPELQGETNARDMAIFQIVKAKRILEQGNAKRAFKIVDAIEGPMANEKFFLLIKAIMASAYDETIYKNILEDFAKLYPDDPTLYLKMIDYYFLKENYKMVHVYLDKLIFETGDDFLNLMKAHAYLLQENFVKAETHYNYIKVNYPTNFSAYLGEMISLSYQNRFEDTLSIAQYLVDEGYDKEELTLFFEEKEPDGSNQLEAFVESEIYKAWKSKP